MLHFVLYFLSMAYYLYEQECIPVGCVPAARGPYAGVCFPRGGVSGRGGGVWSKGGWYVWSGGGGGCLVWGVSAPGCVSGPGGGWWHPSMH